MWEPSDIAMIYPCSPWMIFDVVCVEKEVGILGTCNEHPTAAKRTKGKKRYDDDGWFNRSPPGFSVAMSSADNRSYPQELSQL